MEKVTNDTMWYMNTLETTTRTNDTISKELGKKVFYFEDPKASVYIHCEWD